MHKKVLKTLLVSSALLLISSCGSSLKPIEVAPEELNASVINLNQRSKTANSSYKVYTEQVNEKYGDHYLKENKQISIEPTGIPYDPSSQLIHVDDCPDYACVELANSFTTYDLSNIKADGRYYLELEYFVPSSFATAPAVSIEIDNVNPFNEASAIVLPLNYEDNVEKDNDGHKKFDNYVTKYGDQMSPNQKRVLKWQNEGLYESTFSTSEPLVFDLNSDCHSIRIINLSDDYFYVGKLTLKPVVNKDSYVTYHSSYPSSQGLGHYELNAIDYSYKNSNDVTLTNEQTPSVYPYEDDRKLLNVTSGWEKAGQSFSWTFNVESAGFYPITVHYYNGNDNFPLYRKVMINGKVPFKEVENYKFPTTGSNYKNETLGDENGTYYFYFDQGENTITLQASVEPVYEIYSNLMAIYDDINDFAINIRKITGSSTNAYRTYKLTQYFPETPKILRSYKTILQDSYTKLRAIVGNNKASSSLTYYQRMLELVGEFLKEPDDLPLNLKKFSSGDSCLAKLIADSATSLISTNLVFDMMYVSNDESKIRKENASWFADLKSSLVTLGQTFTSDKYKTILNDGELNVWSARSQAYNDILQTFADNEFTPNTKSSRFPNGIKVNIRQMPSEDNLIYAYAANTVPDLVLGINSGRAFEFALRGNAAYPMSDFDSSWKYTNNNYWNFTPYYWDVADNMPHGQLLSMLYNDKFYSIPESTSVQLMFSRDDIMNVMGDNGGILEVPNTWNELIGMLYRIQSYGMNFYYSTSASGSLKGLASTAQFILQNNGSILTETAFEANFRDKNTFEGLKLLTDLYTIYALPTEVASFYNHFRYGTYPLGISDLGMYLSLKYVAPELLGKWSVHPIPGIAQEKQENGHYKDLNHDGEEDDVSRWYISNGSSAMIFNNSKLIDEAWLFLQWWMSTSIQERFTESLQAIYGPSVVWFSANLDAARSLPVDSEVKDVVLKQVNWIIDLQQIPGQYMLERGLSDIWNTVVFGKSSSGESTGKITISEAIDIEKVLVDREVQRKMEEFGYYDTNKNKVIKNYVMRNYDWVEACFDNFHQGGN